MRFVFTTVLLLAAAPAFAEFLCNGVTAHRGNSGEFPENTIPAFQSGIDVGADWIELDIFRTKDGQLVVTHDRTTKRIGDRDLNDRATMLKLLDVGVDRLYTDYPRLLLALKQERQFGNVTCEGTYQHHLQGICTDKEAIYWSFTTTLVKTDLDGKLLKKVPVANHHGDLCFYNGKLYVAVNLGKFNDPEGNADSWIYVYDADTLMELARHEAQEAFHGAGGIGVRNDHFFVVGGLPDGVEENYVYEYDGKFNFLTKHVIKSGHTLLGIQTATFAHDRWWFGCYGDPKILLVTDADFQMKGRYEFDCSLGIEGLSDGRLLSANGRCQQDTGCTGKALVVVSDDETGLRLLHRP